MVGGVPPLALGATFSGETVHVSVGWEGVYEGFPGELKTFFVRGLMFPNEEVFSSSLAQGAVGSVGCSSPLGVALHSGIAGSFCFSAIPLHEVGSWGWGCSWRSFPPLGHPESGQAFGW